MPGKGVGFPLSRWGRMGGWAGRGDARVKAQEGMRAKGSKSRRKRKPG